MQILCYHTCPFPVTIKQNPLPLFLLDLLLLSAINIPFFCSPMYSPSPNCSAYELRKAWTCNSVRLERVERLSFSLCGEPPQPSIPCTTYINKILLKAASGLFIYTHVSPLQSQAKRTGGFAPILVPYPRNLRDCLTYSLEQVFVL